MSCPKCYYHFVIVQSLRVGTILSKPVSTASTIPLNVPRLVRTSWAPSLKMAMKIKRYMLTKPMKSFKVQVHISCTCSK